MEEHFIAQVWLQMIHTHTLTLIPIYSHPPPQWMVRIKSNQRSRLIIQNLLYKYLSYHNSLNVSRLFHTTLYTSIYIYTLLEYSMTFQSILEPSRVFWNLLGHSRTFRNHLEYSQTLQKTIQTLLNLTF